MTMTTPGQSAEMWALVRCVGTHYGYTRAEQREAYLEAMTDMPASLEIYRRVVNENGLTPPDAPTRRAINADRPA